MRWQRFFHNLVYLEASFLVIRQGMRTIKVASVQPDSAGIHIPGARNPVAKKVLAQPPSHVVATQSEIGDFNRAIVMAKQFHIAGRRSADVQNMHLRAI